MYRACDKLLRVVSNLSNTSPTARPLTGPSLRPAHGTAAREGVRPQIVPA